MALLRPVGGPHLPDLQAPCLAPPSTASLSPWAAKIAVRKDDPKAFESTIRPRTIPSWGSIQGTRLHWALEARRLEGAAKAQPCVRQGVTQGTGAPSYI